MSNSQTEKNLASRKATENEALFRSLIQNSPDLICILDTDGILRFVSPVAQKLLGYETSVLEGKPFTDLIRDGDRQTFSNAWNQTLEHPEETQMVELCLLASTSQEVQVEMVMQNRLGEPVINGILISTRDLTWRKQAEGQLQEAAESITALMSSFTDSIFIMDCEGTVIKTNETNARRLGVAPIEIEGHSIYDFLPKEVGDSRRKWVEEIIRSRRPVHFEDQCDELFIEQSVYPILGADGNVARLIVSARDITERKLAQEAYENLVNYSLQAFVIFQDGRVVFANPEAERMSGYTRDELYAMPPGYFFTLVPEADRADRIQMFQNRMAGKDLPERVEMRIIRKGGETRWLESFPRVVTYRSTPALQTVFVDITDRKCLEIQLQESEARLKEAERLAQLGHWELDLRTNRFYWSDEIYRIFEIPSSEFTASYEGFLEMVHPADRELVDHTYIESLKTKLPYRLEHRILLKDGRIKFVHEQCETFFDEQGVAIRSLGTVQDITERKQSEEQLRKLSRAVEAAPISIVITDKDAQIEYANPFFSNLTGYEKDEVLGKNPRILQSGKTPSETYPLLWETILVGHSWQGEFINKKKNGELYIEAAQISPIFDAEGKITHFVAIKQDITERKQIEQKLVKSEERYRLITQNADDILWTMNMELRFTFVSPAMERAFGYPTAELIALAPEQLLTPESYNNGLTAFMEEVEKALPQPDPNYARVLELECRRKNGSTFWVEAKFTFFRDTDGQLIGFLGVGRDITDRKRSDDELRASEARYRSLFEQTHDAVFILDLEGHHLAANQRATDMLGYTKAELVTLSVNQTSAEIDQSKNVIVRLLAGESIPLYERLFRKKNGDVFPVEINVELVRDKDGEPLHIQSVVRDITERKQMEIALRRREREFSSLVENTTDLVARFDTELRYTYCNSEFERKGSRPISAYLGRTILEVGARKRESVIVLDRAARQVLETGEIQQVEHELLTKFGFRHYQTRVIPERNDEGRIVSLLSVGRDITDHKQLESVLREAKEFAENLATVDELTGLYNRRGFLEICRREVGRLQRFGRPISVLFADIDHFKQFNDRYSYEVGDQVLRQVAQTLQHYVREIDVVGRHGGEEMVVFLPETDRASAVEIAERLRMLVEGLRVFSDQSELKVTVSIGVATLYPVPNQTIPTTTEGQTTILENLIAEAGKALHVAKQQGRNQVVACT